MKAVILDDEVILANSLAAKLESRNFEVRTFYSYEDFASNIYEACDIYILDISIWDTSGFDVVGELKSRNIETPIIFISWHESLNYKLEWLNMWADDYLVKPFHPDELLARIKTVLRRKHPEIQENIIQYKNISLNFETRELSMDDIIVEMTKREKDIIEFLLLRQWLLVTKKQLIEWIWWEKSYDGVTDNNINVTICNIRNKLGKDFQLETKIGEGYILKK